MLSILHMANHGPSLDRKAIRFATSFGVDSIGFTEAYKRIPYLRTRFRYYLTVGRSKTDKRRGAKDNPILTRRRNKSVQRGAFKGCEASTPEKIAPERWVTYNVFRHAGVGLVAHIAIHPNAAVQLHPTSDRYLKYQEQMRKVEQLVHGLRAHYPKLHVVITGDLNWHKSGPVSAYSPVDVCAALDLDYVNRGLDWVLYSKGLQVHHMREVSRARNGQDHPWLLLHFTETP